MDEAGKDADAGDAAAAAANANAATVTTQDRRASTPSADESSSRGEAKVDGGDGDRVGAAASPTTGCVHWDIEPPAKGGGSRIVGGGEVEAADESSTAGDSSVDAGWMSDAVNRRDGASGKDGGVGDGGAPAESLPSPTGADGELGAVMIAPEEPSDAVVSLFDEGDEAAMTRQTADPNARRDGEDENLSAAGEGVGDHEVPVAATDGIDVGDVRDCNHLYEEKATDGDALGEALPLRTVSEAREAVLIAPQEPSDALSPLSDDVDETSKEWLTAAPDAGWNDVKPAGGGKHLSIGDLVANEKSDEKSRDFPAKTGPEVIAAAEPPLSSDISRMDIVPGAPQSAAAQTMPDDDSSKASKPQGRPGAFPVAGIRAREREGRMGGGGGDHHESWRGIEEVPSPVLSADVPAGGAPITATPVEEPVYAEAVATPVDIGEQQQPPTNGILLDRRLVCRIGVAVAVIVLVLAITIPLVLLRDTGPTPPTPAPVQRSSQPSSQPSTGPSVGPSSIPSGPPTASPTSERLSAVVNFALDRNISTIAALDDVNSPQYRAADWVANVDPATVALTDDSGGGGGNSRSVMQRYVLAVLYYSTGGEDWYDQEAFLSGLNECEWGGDANWLGCDDERTIFGLSIHYNRLNGTIPHELASLSELTYLSLFGNSLFGPIPPSLGSSLTNLTALRLRSNDLTSAIPASLGALINLQAMELAYNDLTGAIPTTLGDLTRLEMLTLSFNELSGGLPSEMGMMTSLTVLEMEGIRNLGGTLPSQMGNLVNLEHLILDGKNELGGSVPSEFGYMTSLEVLDLRQCNLNGTIPRQLGDLAGLEELRLSMNAFTGPIPSELGLLTALRILSLAGNEHTGNVTDLLGSLGNETLASADIYLHNNDLTGSAEVMCSYIGDTLTVDLKEIECSCCICCPCRPGEDCSLDVRF